MGVSTYNWLHLVKYNFIQIKQTLKNLLYLLIFVFLFGNCKKETTTATVVTVYDVDGNTYSPVVIGTQTWLTTNLKTTKYKDGIPIAPTTDNIAWKNLSIGGSSWYNNDVTNKNTYGGLYNWTAVATGNLCPAGWHVPTDADWTILSAYLGGDAVSGGKLKETGTTHWLSPNTGATNETGFLALPGGSRSGTTGIFSNVGSGSGWWSSTSNGNSSAWLRSLAKDSSGLNRSSDGINGGYSVRCVKD